MSSSHERLIRRLGSIAEIAPEDAEALLGLPIRVARLKRHVDIVSDGDHPTRCCLVLEGFVCRYKLTSRGKRQILSFHIPGDIPDLQSLHIGLMDHSLATVTDCTVGYIDHGDMRRLMLERPKLVAPFWRETLIDAGMFREWMTGLGRREAYGRMARLFCELSVKLQAVGLAEPERFPMPMTQVDLADALGLTSVHVNRTLKEMRERDLIETPNGYIAFPDWDALCQAAEFDPAYLHLKQPDFPISCEPDEELRKRL